MKPVHSSTPTMKQCFVIDEGKQGDNISSLDVLLFLFGTSLLFHVQYSLLLPDVHIGFSRSRSGGLVFPSLSEFSTRIVAYNIYE